MDIKVYEEKKNYVQALNKVLKEYHDNIENIEYVAYKRVDNDEWIDEYVIVTYKGNDRCVFSANCDSLSSIFEEIAKRIDSGRYIQAWEKRLENVSNSVDWVKILYAKKGFESLKI